MSEHVVVKEVGEGRPWEHGITYWDVCFERNGEDFHCTWGKKDSPPAVGEQAEGEFFQKDGEWRFRKASKPQGGSSGSFEASAPRTSSGGKSDDVQRQITRQHSQTVAVNFASVMQAAGRLADNFSVTDLKEWIDWFDADVFGQTVSQGAGDASGAVAAAAPQGASPATTPAPDKPPASEVPADESGLDLHRVDGILYDEGVTDGPERSWLGKAWEALAQDKKQTAFDNLVNGGPPRRAAVARLRELAGPVPQEFREEEEIPFARPEYRETFSERLRWRFP